MANDGIRQDMVDLVREEQNKRPRAPRTHRVADANPQPQGLPVVDTPLEGGGDAPRKRRRRRRTGAAKGEGTPADGTASQD